MGAFRFSKADLRIMKALGITEERVLSQIEIFKKSSFHKRLIKPCTAGDGILRIQSGETDRLVALHQKAAEAGRLQKFIPASGAATRMFQTLMQIYYVPQFLDCDELYQRAAQGVAVACDFVRFLEELHRFPFLEDLRTAIARDGLRLSSLLKQYRFRIILEYLLTAKGLNYSVLPKGLLKFHRYPDGCRTAFEEHLVEACHYIQNGTGECRLHFTISPEHEEGFRVLYNAVRCTYENRYGTSFKVDFSHQKPSTNTIAVDLENRPFRERSGILHFRPGGHGAILENLNDLKGDILYIKNVDNIIPDRLKESTVFYKKVLGGYLLNVESAVHWYVRSLCSETVPGAVIEEAATFASKDLLIIFPSGYDQWPVDRKRAFLLSKLNRPIRVCGVVQNSGEPGGAPFWVEDDSGSPSLQIVEQSQVDFSVPEQHEIWKSSTHFNPVDIVCSVKDYEGQPFDLKKYVDNDAVFISRKSKDGQDIKALELPGLWNGSMADWITVILEVPQLTFNPVKTVYDLLRPEHQP